MISVGIGDFILYIIYDILVKPLAQSTWIYSSKKSTVNHKSLPFSHSTTKYSSVLSNQGLIN
jgi:hypothetical protein